MRSHILGSLEPRHYGQKLLCSLARVTSKTNEVCFTLVAEHATRVKEKGNIGSMTSSQSGEHGEEIIK